jgi:diacylglycerol kinase family enzyme
VIRRFAMETGELLRIHVMGGTGTLFEAVNGVIGMPNVHIAAYPFGRENAFLHYFDADKLHLFSSIRSQVFSSTQPMDALKCGNNYGIAYGMVGLEATVAKNSQESVEHSALLPDFAAYFRAGLKSAFTDWVPGKKYLIDLDGKTLDGVYISALIANGPCYGKNMSPAVEAHPNDGVLDIYLINDVSRLKMLLCRQAYLSGKYEKFPRSVSHYRGKKIAIDSGDVMIVCLDGQIFYENLIDFEVIPYAVDFVCPSGVDVGKLPRIYGRPNTVAKED